MEITKKYKGYTLKVVMTEAKLGYRYDIYLDGKNKGALCGKGYTPNYMFQILEGLVDDDIEKIKLENQVLREQIQNIKAENFRLKEKNERLKQKQKSVRELMVKTVWEL